MKITGQYLEDQFRTAEQIEIAEGNGEHLFGDIVSALDREQMNEGFAISFGSNRDSLQRVIDVIELDKHTGGKSSSYQICQAICYNGRGCTGFVGKALPALSELSLVDAVEVLQADDWLVENRKQYPYIRASGDVVTSSLVLSARFGELDERGLSKIDASLPGFVISASFRYSPDFTPEREFCGVRSLPYFLEDCTEPYDDPGYGVIELAKAVQEGIDPLRMPGANYLLSYGKLLGRGYPLGIVDSVKVPWGNRFMVEDGSLVDVSSPYDD